VFVGEVLPFEAVHRKTPSPDLKVAAHRPEKLIMRKNLHLIRLFSLLAVSFWVLLFGVTDAAASHYDLVDVELIAPEAQAKLIESGILDTKALLDVVVTSEGREAIAKVSGLQRDEVDDLAQVLEFMQIVGIGPKAARLLIAAGTPSVAALAKSTPNELLERLTTANLALQITGVDPDMAVVVDWIDKAGHASVALQ